MGSISIWHWIILSLSVVIVVVPIARIFQRTGRSGWWAVLMLVPLINIVVLWALAFMRWPAVDKDLPNA